MLKIHVLLCQSKTIKPISESTLLKDTSRLIYSLC